VADFPAVNQHLMMRVLTLCLSVVVMRRGLPCDLLELFSDSFTASICPLTVSISSVARLHHYFLRIYMSSPLERLFGLHCFMSRSRVFILCVTILCDWLLAIPLRVACCLWIFLLTWGHSPVSAALYRRYCFVDSLLLWLLLSMRHSLVSSRCGVC
jgi:hypothetical protein